MKRNYLRRRGLRGNTMLESALVLWPFMLLVLGIIQIGFVVWSNSTLSYAVDSAVRYASLNGARSSTPATVASIQQSVRTNALGLKPTDLSITVTWLPNNRPGSTVRVQAVYAVPTLINVVWKNPFPLRATSQMLIVN